VDGQTFCLSAADGRILPGGNHGLFIRDTRMLSSLLVRINGEHPTDLGGYPLGPGAARFTACAMANGNNDPALLIERRRVVTEAFWERLRITNHSAESVAAEVEVEVEADFAYVFDVKNGRSQPVTLGTPVGRELRFDAANGAGHAVLRADPVPDRVEPGLLCWSLTLPAQSTWDVQLLLGQSDEQGTVWPSRERPRPPSGPPPAADAALATLEVDCNDERFSELVAQGILDLKSLLVWDGEERFFAAGTPWFLTLFGRDSLWAARMSLPLGTQIAGETLRVLARYQGVTHDPVTEEAPGKILHEIRHGTLVDRGDLPPRYYGTVDATPLFVVLLERAWRWGLAPAVVEALLPHAERALAWMVTDGDPDGDGFLEYRAVGERRLANQGWKDSGDAIFFATGELAEPPIALCEVQGYAYQAALAGAALLEAFDRPGAAQWRAWGAQLRARFRESFWVGRGASAFPTMALDGRKVPVDTVASNMGHLPGTGILDPAESALVAARLAQPDMDCGWGLRTVSSSSLRFNPLSYHGGSVWPHDSAIAVDGLATAGADSTATSILRGLVAAGQRFEYRMPELFGGEQRGRGTQPLPYPSACRPQAWAAGSALLLLRAVLGIEPDVPAGVLRIRPMRPAPFAHLGIEGMSVAGGRLSLLVEGGVTTVTEAPAGLDVVVE
jgi:glycogen debranching enzyme